MQFEKHFHRRDAEAQRIALAHKPPFVCVFCGSGKKFTAAEHLVPHSLGNKGVVLPAGWVCDTCNNKFSAFEAKAITESILGVERCRLGITTKKGKASTAAYAGAKWTGVGASRVQVEADWSRGPSGNWSLSSNNEGRVVALVHDHSCYALSKLLLKIGVLTASCLIGPPVVDCAKLEPAKHFVLGGDASAWPYFVVEGEVSHLGLCWLGSQWKTLTDEMWDEPFDLAIHEIDDEIVAFFKYGKLVFAVSVVSRTTGWRIWFAEEGLRYIGCPHEFSGESL